MRCLIAVTFILLLGTATAPDAASQNVSTSYFGEFLSSIVGAQDAHTPTVILDDDEGDDRARNDEARDRNRERTERGREGVGRGESGRGTVEGRGGADRGRGEGQAARGSDARQRSERGETARERSVPGDRAESRRDEGARTSDGARQDDVYRSGGEGRQGPAFCRSGAGHPVFGTSWCHDKGFGIGGQNAGNRRSGTIDDGPWNRPREGRGNEGPSAEGGWIGDILGLGDK